MGAEGLSDRTNTKRLSRLALATVVLALLPASLPALTRTVELDGCRVTVFAPDWIWQGQTVNIFASAAGAAGAARTLELELAPPPEAAVEYALPPSLHAAADVPSEGRARIALPGLTPRPDAAVGTYAFNIVLRFGTATESVPYPLRVIRGSLVDAGIWSVLLPALAALLWSGVLLAVLPRFAGRGAWKRPSEPFREEANAGEWFHEPEEPR